MSTRCYPWTIAGAEGEDILGNVHEPDDRQAPRGVMLLLHGFLGYKDYGMFPFLADRLAGAGCIVHRFNFSHSGMTNNIEKFERPDLFERDTWNRQVTDVNHVLQAIDVGELPGRDLPFAIYGHSRGGVTALFTAGRRFREGHTRLPVGVIPAATPDFTNRFTEEQQAEILQRGYTEVVSNRTRQTLKVGREFLAEQLDDPAGHDLFEHVRAISCPLLILHGSIDPTVPPRCAKSIAEAAGPERDDVEVLFIPNGDHVFNTPNPMPVDDSPSPQLSAVIDAMTVFLDRVMPANRSGSRSG